MATLLSTPKAAPTAAAGGTANSAATGANQRMANLGYLLASQRKQAVCPPSAGAGNNQAFATGATLIYDVPTAQGAYLEELLVECVFTVTPASGAGATYALNKSAPLGLIDQIWVEYAGRQITIPPVILRDVLNPLLGFQRPPLEQVVQASAAATGAAAGYTANATLSGVIWGANPIIVGSGNSWKFWFRLPLRGLLPGSAAGMLPIQGDSTRAQIKIVCASAVMGVDPRQQVIAATGGAGNAVTATGTIQVNAIYTDGTNLMSPSPATLNLQGLPTVQYITDRQLNPLTASSVLRSRIDSKLQHIYVASLLIDGNQSTDYALNSNIQNIELTMDNNGTNKFYAFGVNGNNITLNEWMESLRASFGQDLAQGVIPWVAGPLYLPRDLRASESGAYLDMTPGHWPDASYGVQVAAVSGVAGITPRVETYLISVNQAGLQAING